MAQNFQLSELGQFLTISTGNSILLTATSVNAASYTVGTAFVVNTSQVTVASIPVSANGGTGNTGQVLTSNGSTGAPYWSSIPAGGGPDKAFFINDQTITTNYTITTGKNAGTFGPVTINSGITVTVPSGSTWSII